MLRFWETRFSTIKPLKRGGGRRYYRPEDVLLLKGIRHLLYDQGFTIKGVQRILKDQGIRYVVGIGEGRVMEPLTNPPARDDEPDFEPAAPRIAHRPDDDDHEPEMPRVPMSGKSLTDKDRDKLAGVLRELLDCKRILERAREG